MLLIGSISATILTHETAGVGFRSQATAGSAVAVEER